MESREQKYLVPSRLDDPPKFLFWDFDVALVFLCLMLFGIISGFSITGGVLGLLAGYYTQKLKGGESKGYMIHVLYWTLPFGFFKRIPESSKREFLG